MTGFQGATTIAFAAVAAAGVKAFAEIVKTGAEFEAKMSRVKAISGETGDAFDALVEQAKELGANTAFSATEAAAGMENLASAGFDAMEIMGAMPGVLDLAAVSGGDVALASENMSSALRAFGGSAEEAGHYADVFANAAARTNAETLDMGYAMKYAATPMHALGYAVEDTAALIGMLADAGIKGSQAGTTLRTVALNLADGIEISGEALGDVLIQTEDSTGAMRPLADIIEEVQAAFDQLTPAEKAAAAEAEAGKLGMSGFLAIVDQGPEKLRELTTAYKEETGVAKEMAEVIQNNLTGAMEQFGGAVETLQLTVYDSIKGGLVVVVKEATEVIDVMTTAFEANSDVILGALAGIATGAGVYVTLKGLMLGAKVAQDLLNLSMATNPIGVVALAIGGLTAVIAPFVLNAMNAADESERLNAEMTELSENLSKNSQIDSAIKKYKELSTKLKDTSLTAEEASTVTAELNTVRQWIIDNSDGIVTAEGEITGAIEDQIEQLEQMNEVQRKAYDAELLNKHAEAIGRLPELEAEQNRLLAERDALYQQVTEDTALSTELKMKEIELQSLVSSGILDTVEGQVRYNELLAEASALTEGAYAFQHLAGLDATITGLGDSVENTNEDIAKTTEQIAEADAAAQEYKNVGLTLLEQGLISADEALKTYGISAEEAGEKALEAGTDTATGMGQIQEVVNLAEGEVASAFAGIAASYDELSETQQGAIDSILSAYETMTAQLSDLQTELALTDGRTAESIMANQDNTIAATETFAEEMGRAYEMGLSGSYLAALGLAEVEALPALQSFLDAGPAAVLEKQSEWEAAFGTIADTAVSSLSLEGEQAQAVKDFVLGESGVLGSVKSAVESADFKSIFLGVGEGAAEGIKESAPLSTAAVTQMTEDDAEAAKTGLNSHSPSIIFKDIYASVPEGAALGISENANLPVEAINEMNASIIEAATTDADAFVKFGESVPAKIAEGIKSGSATVVTETTILIDSINTKFTELPALLEPSFTASTTVEQEWIADMESQASTRLPTLMKQIVSYFSTLPASISSELSKTTSTVSSWFSSLISLASSNMPRVVDAILNPLQTTLQSGAQSAGEDFIDAFGDGIDSRTGSVIDSVSSFVDEIISMLEEAMYAMEDIAYASADVSPYSAELALDSVAPAAAGTTYNINVQSIPQTPYELMQAAKASAELARW